MAKDPVQIANLAIAKAKSTNFIESLDEGSTEAQTCELWYETSRDYVLSRADWPFARKRVALVLNGDPPPEWGYRYALPADCIAPRGVEDGAVVRRLEERVSYMVENDGTGENRVILMDVTEAVLLYTMRVTAPKMFSEGFTNALIWRIASEIALPLGKEEAFAIRLAQVAEQMIEKGAAQDFNQDHPVPAPDSEFYTSRIG